MAPMRDSMNFLDYNACNYGYEEECFYLDEADPQSCFDRAVCGQTIIVPGNIDIENRITIKGPITIQSHESSVVRRRGIVKSGTDIDWSASRIDCPIDVMWV